VQLVGSSSGLHLPVPPPEWETERRNDASRIDIQYPAALSHSHHLLEARSHENKTDKKQYLMGYFSGRQPYLAEEEAPITRCCSS